MRFLRAFCSQPLQIALDFAWCVKENVKVAVGNVYRELGWKIFGIKM